MEGAVIETRRLAAGPWKEEYTEEFIRMNGDERVMRYFPRTLTRRESLGFIDRIVKEIEERGYGLWALSRLHDGRFIGFVGLHRFEFDADFAPGTEIGWRLLPEYWGNGYATEMASACLDYARNVLSLQQVYSFTPIPNIASQRVMQKCGMKMVCGFDHPLVEKGHSLRRHVLYKTVW